MVVRHGRRHQEPQEVVALSTLWPYTLSMIENKFSFKRIGTYSTGHPNFAIFRGVSLLEDGWYSEAEAQARVNYLQSLQDQNGPTWSFNNVKLSLCPGVKALSSI